MRRAKAAGNPTGSGDRGRLQHDVAALGKGLDHPDEVGDGGAGILEQQQQAPRRLRIPRCGPGALGTHGQGVGQRGRPGPDDGLVADRVEVQDRVELDEGRARGAGVVAEQRSGQRQRAQGDGRSHDQGPRGITVNLVHPGSTDTDMNPAAGPGADPQRARMPIQEYGKPEDIAGAVAWLAGPEGRFANGAGFVVDGGANA